ncbi:hypothetical protein LRP31_34840 (plasmid) [Mesorhizobium mediterraneum]|uniref:Surface antigen domain-containing protein n=1 Tax=Mesorhizobium mediterraneum TaxID=43617 RepID=A0AB36RHM8_9HYPH|nr:hypothetical protein [Mesorhizobium mediterraneum]PAQ03802.1 hypothetical protein CIT25_03125 [Mesorhizobium mediterraneum]WIW57375.1 hypothetical protein LRP31_34840 [Mesorhizobium mediterraneum]
MNQNALLTIAATVGLLAGTGGTWLAMPGVEAQALSKAELTAAISADPSLCPVPQAPIVEAPTEDEALAAFRKAQEASPLVWDRNNVPEISLALGQCDKNSSGPGVSCMTSIKMSPQAQPLDRVVGFAKGASGEWIATIN